MHACPTCGHDGAGAGGVYLFRDVREDETENLRAQVKDNPALRPLISALRGRLAIEDRAAADAERIIREVFDGVVAALREVDGSTRRGALTRQAILTASLADLAKLLGPALDEARTRVEQAYREMLETNRDLAAAAAQIPAGTLGIRTSSLDALIGGAAADFWSGKVAMPAASIIREGLKSAMTGETLNTAIDRVAKQLDTSAGKAATEVRTNLGTFDRLAAEESASAAGLDLRVYLGPLDSLTRPFCRALINRAFTLEHVAELDNGQTGPGLWGGGGYNCRHRWVAVRAPMLERLRIPLGTDADIERANRAGAR